MRFVNRRTLIATALLMALIAGFVVWALPGYVPQTLGNAVRHADAILLYEGLPHQLYEEDLLANELRTKPTREFGGYSFYKDHLSLKAIDAARLVDLLEDSTAWKAIPPDSPTKPCGGFHPDYAVELQRGTARWYVLICFGCGEATIISPWRETTYDLDRDWKRQVHTLLLAYRQNRPRSEHRTAVDQNIEEGW